MFFAMGATLSFGRQGAVGKVGTNSKCPPPSLPTARSARGREGKFALRGSVNLSLDLIA
jgi:hypothetical protein